MSQKKIDWQELDREYFELWDWILKECDGEWATTYQDQCSQKAEEHKIKKDRFNEICRQINDREQSYYFCWMKTINHRWSRYIPYQPPPQNETQWYDQCMSNKPLDEIDYILRGILGASERYYWFVSLLSALPESTDDKEEEKAEEEVKRELEHARAAYRLRHHQYSAVFDHLLGISRGFTKSLETLREYLRSQLQFYEDERVEIARNFTAIRVDTISRKRAYTIDSAATVELSKFLTPELDSEPMDCKHYSFFFCEKDFIYPHCRRCHLAPLFQKFRDLAAVDYFYKYHIDLEVSELTRWPDETTHIIDRWSKEHVEAFKDFFIHYAEEENEKWRGRFDAVIDSESPDVAEKYLKSVYRIGAVLPSKAENNNIYPASPASSNQATRTKKKQVKSGTRRKQMPTRGAIHFALCDLFRENETHKNKTAKRLAEILNRDKEKKKYKFKKCSDSGVKATQAWHDDCKPLRRREKTITRCNITVDGVSYRSRSRTRVE